MHNFKKLKIRNESINLVSETYKITKTFHEYKKYTLTSKMNRYAIYIPSNIAEGSIKSTNRHFKNYLEISLGSAFEWETQLIIAFNQQYVSGETFNQLEEKIKELQKMISSFQSSLDI